MRTRTLVPALLTLLTVLPVHATLIVRAGDTEGSSADFDGPVPVLSARDTSSGISHVVAAPLGSPCFPCATTGAPFYVQEASARTNGSLRVNAVVSDMSGTAASASAAIVDTLTFWEPGEIEVWVSGEHSAVGDSAAATIAFSFSRVTGNPDNPFEEYFSWSSSTDDMDPGKPWLFQIPTPPTLPGFPPGLLLGTPLEISFSLRAYADCGFGGGDCYARAFYARSAYINITGNYTSANGYVYDAVPPAGVPEPGAAILVAIGLAAVGARRVIRKPVCSGAAGPR